ncbi:MAG: sialate O-acetylesterase, partial [Verrucomicrobia bacterium]|nr:sialate O-acetylesterase [Verrucomicrobiota bacterium]
MKTVLFFLLSCGWINGMSFAQELSLHPLLRDGAVLQRDVPVPITGLAPAGTQVWLNWKNKTYTTSADTSGKWAVLLPPGPAETQGQTLRVKSGTSSLQITNLLVGEVWLASGQSNMEWILAECVTQSAEAAKAADPLLRFTTIPRIIAETPAATVPVTWQAATPD